MNTLSETYQLRAETVGEATSSVAWGAVVAGAVVAAAVSLILLALGSGLGLSSISLFSYDASTAKELGAASIVWLVVMSVVASALGGYITGRLRVRWLNLHSDEVHFRDTAHGLVTWALATVVTAAVLTSAAAGILGAATKVATGAASAVAAASTAASPVPERSTGTSGLGSRYVVDQLFRTRQDDASSPAPALVEEATAILLSRSTSAGGPIPEDRAQLANLVSRQTGLAEAEAEQRVDQVIGQARAAMETASLAAREAAEAARAAAATLALWIVVSLLAGAFCAALAATLGGLRRDAAVHRSVS